MKASFIPRTTIDRFKGDNFSQWKHRVILLLKEEEVYQYATGTAPAANAQDADAVASFAKSDLKALNIINQCLDDSLISLVESEKKKNRFGFAGVAQTTICRNKKNLFHSVNGFQ